MNYKIKTTYGHGNRQALEIASDISSINIAETGTLCFDFTEYCENNPFDSPHRMGDGIVYLPIADISNFVERVMVHPLADDGYVSLIEKICQHFGIQFWGRSKIYEYSFL